MYKIVSFLYISVIPKFAAQNFFSTPNPKTVPTALHMSSSYPQPPPLTNAQRLWLEHLLTS